MTKLVDQPSPRPTRKLTGGVIAGALVTAVLGLTGIELEAEVVAAITTLVSALVAYFTRERA